MFLQFEHSITEKRDFGRTTVNQSMVIRVDYNEGDDTYDIIGVDLYEGGVFKAEISKLLDKAEGSPLCVMLEAIEWSSLYADRISKTVNF